MEAPRTLDRILKRCDLSPQQGQMEEPGWVLGAVCLGGLTGGQGRRGWSQKGSQKMTLYTCWSKDSSDPALASVCGSSQAPSQTSALMPRGFLLDAGSWHRGNRASYSSALGTSWKPISQPGVL